MSKTVGKFSQGSMVPHDPHPADSSGGGTPKRAKPAAGAPQGDGIHKGEAPHERMTNNDGKKAH